MSTEGPCQNATAPIDITESTQPCSGICNYTFSYALSTCQLANKGEYLSIITSTRGNVIKFNNLPFTLTETRLYHPSLHTFDGAQTDAELILVHGGPNGQNFLVCIPIVSGSGSSQTATFFNAFVPLIPQSSGTNIMVDVNNWSLNNIVPNAPFYFYQATAPFPPCTGSYNLIVFGKSSAAHIAAADLPHLKAAITAQTYVAKGAPAKGLFYNKSGTLSQSGGSGSDSEIYIDCRPEGEEYEEEVDDVNIPKFDVEHEEDDIKKMLHSKWAAAIIYIIMGIVGLTIFKKIYNMVLHKFFKKKS